MANQEPKNKDNNDNPVNNYIKYSAIGFQMVCIIGAMCFAGYKLDEHYKHGIPWATAALSLAGVFISLYIVIRSINN